MAATYNVLSVGGINLYDTNTGRLAPNGYTPQAAKPQVLYAAGLPVARSYAPVEESFELIIKASDTDSVVADKHDLQLALDSAWYTQPCVVSLQGKGQTNAALTEVYQATLQEGPEFIGKEAGAFTARIRGTWIRAPFWGRTTTANGLQSNSFGNGSGTANNQPMQGSGGDLDREGSPLNLKLTGTSLAAAWSEISLASALTVIQTSNSTSHTTTNTGVGDLLLTGLAIGTLTAAQVHAVPCRARVVARLASATNPSKIELKAQLTGTEQGKWTPLGSDGGSTTTGAQWVDLGDFPLDHLRSPYVSSYGVGLNFFVRSKDGTSISLQLSYFELIVYYTWCTLIDASGTGGVTTSQSLAVVSASNRSAVSSGPYLPVAPYAHMLSSGNAQLGPWRIRGSVPATINGARLYVVGRGGGGAHTSGDTATIVGAIAPLWRTLRGAL